MSGAPKFVKFVSCVEGRLQSRWDATGLFFGARLSSPNEVAGGADPIVWYPDQVIPLTDEFVRLYSRELEQAVAMGDLVVRTEADFTAFEDKRLTERKRRDEERKAKADAEAKAKAEAEASGSTSANSSDESEKNSAAVAAKGTRK